MHCIEMTEANERELRRNFTHHKCAQVRLRCLVVQLRGHGLPQGQVETLTGAATSSQTLWARQWRQGGIEALLKNGHRGRQSSISSTEEQALLKQFADNPPATLVEAGERIKQVTGRPFSISGTRKILCNKLKLRHRKAKQVPPRCDDPKKKTNRTSGNPEYWSRC